MTAPAAPPAPKAPVGKPTAEPIKSFGTAPNKRAELCDLADCIAKIANVMPHPSVMDSDVHAKKLHGYVKRIKQIAQTV